MRVLFIGDIFGAAGVRMVCDSLPRLLDEYRIDFTVANAENAAAGFGLNRRHYNELYDCGVDCFTMGNHTWDCKEIYALMDAHDNIVRPANYAPGRPGIGWQCFEPGKKYRGKTLLVIDLIGRVGLPPNDCPFRRLDEILQQNKADWTLVDIHAEATSEKVAMGWYADGRVSAVVGTHTHIQTADARVLPHGCGYLTDAGMTGPRDSVLGVDKEIIIERFLTGYSPRFEAAHGDLQFNGVIFDLDDENGGCREVIPLNFSQPSL